MGNTMIRIMFIIMILSLPLSAGAQELRQTVKDLPDRIFLVNEYRYDPDGSSGDPEIGLSLCGTRCNALSADYRNITEAGGWRLIRISSNKELTFELNNPFMTGHCICIADEYIVKIDDRNFPKERTTEAQESSQDRKNEKM